MSASHENKNIEVLKDCPELFSAAVSMFLRKIRAVCDRYEIAGECYTKCPLYGKSCGLTKHAADEEISAVLEIIEEFEEKQPELNKCDCGYIFNNDTEYNFCPFCGAEKRKC